MKFNSPLLLLLGIFISIASQGQEMPARKPVDPVGFATKAWQMDSIMARIEREYGNEINSSLARINMGKGNLWKAVICPHDDYAYAGWLYPAVLKNVRAKTVIMIGVAHKAKQFGLEDKMVFGNFTRWSEPYGPVRVSLYQGKIMNGLPKSTYIIHDSLQMAEHSLEAIVPFLQYYNRDIEIIPILVPYMSFKTMKGLSLSLAKAIRDLMLEEGLEWNRDIAIVISTDAVHYGDDEWGGKNYAPYGTDSAGYLKAVAHEHGIIDSTLTGPLTEKKIGAFFNCTVRPDNYREYQWTWCGRYSVPFGLLTTVNLAKFTHTPVKGSFVGYANSIDHKPLNVTDLKMGTTATATPRHWVGYAAIGYK